MLTSMFPTEDKSGYEMQFKVKIAKVFMPVRHTGRIVCIARYASWYLAGDQKHVQLGDKCVIEGEMRESTC